MISAPRIYADWINLLDQLADRTNDEEVLSAMQRGTLEWQAGVADRFSKKLLDTVSLRIDRATDRFQRDMSYSRGQERGIVQALVALRRELAFLVKVVDLPVIPEPHRKKYTDMVRQNAKQIQTNLEDSAKSDRSGKTSVVVRTNRVDNI